MNVIEIGSCARGDRDRWSDRDMLVVADASQLPGLAASYARQGASVVSLTPRKFQWLASRGSLFLKHAIDEGVVLEGSVSTWCTLAGSWNSTGNYSSEIESNRNFLPLLRSVPRGPDGAAAAVDILVCSVRNILIRELATRGIFKFAWRDIAEASHGVFKLPRGAWGAVSWARREKNRRRAGVVCRASAVKVEEFADLFRSVLGRRLIGWTSSNAKIERVAADFSDGSYAQLRAFEMMCANWSGDVGLRRLREISARPSYFCSGRSGLH